MKKKSILRKVLIVALAAAMLTGTGFTTAGSYVGTDISVHAAEVDGDFEYEIDEENGTAAITKYTGEGGDVTIPDMIDGKSVTKLADSAFESSAITSVRIPDSVTEFGKDVFYDCAKLVSVRLPAELESMGENTFAYCESLKSVELPEGLKTIGKRAFEGCIALENVIFPDSLESMGDAAFLGCESFTDITIPAGITEIPYAAFEACTELVNIEFPDTVTSVGVSLFGNCDNLEKVTLSKNITAIPNGLFYSCPNLKTVVIPDSVQTIGNSAFFLCSSLESINIPYGVTTIDSSTFYGCNALKEIHIPDSVTSIGSMAFTTSFYPDMNAVICGEKGSYAETYVNENNLPFASEFTNASRILMKEIILGNTIAVDAYSVLGEGDCTYAVYYKKVSDKKWTVKQDFSANQTVEIKPAKAADYQICVKAKDSTGKIVKKYFDIKVNAKLSNQSTLSAENIVIGQKITVNGLAKGGLSEYGCEYQVLYKQASQTKWTTAQDFDQNNTVTFKPAKAAAYDVCVKVRDYTGTVVKKYFTVNVARKLQNTSSLSADTIKLGEKITASCSAQGGIGNYQYQVLYKQASQAKWTTAQEFGENNAVTFKPAKKTEYDVCVKVKDNDGTIIKRFFKVNVG